MGQPGKVKAPPKLKLAKAPQLPHGAVIVGAVPVTRDGQHSPETGPDRAARLRALTHGR